MRSNGLRTSAATTHLGPTIPVMATTQAVGRWLHVGSMELNYTHLTMISRHIATYGKILIELVGCLLTNSVRQFSVASLDTQTLQSEKVSQTTTDRGAYCTEIVEGEISGFR